MKNVIEGLIKNSKKVRVYPTLGIIYISGNEQLKEVYDYYDTLYIDMNNIPLKATTSYDDFISWWIPYRIDLDNSVYKNEEEF